MSIKKLELKPHLIQNVAKTKSNPSPESTSYPPASQTPPSPNFIFIKLNDIFKECRSLIALIIRT